MKILNIHRGILKRQNNSIREGKKDMSIINTKAIQPKTNRFPNKTRH